MTEAMKRLKNRDLRVFRVKHIEVTVVSMQELITRDDKMIRCCMCVLFQVVSPVCPGLAG